MVNVHDESPYPANSPKRHFFNMREEEIEIIDANTLKERLTEQRNAAMKVDGNTSLIVSKEKSTVRKTKALTSQTASFKDYNRIIIYCPTCQGFGRTSRMMPNPLSVLHVNPTAYAELVGGLPVDDESLFLHCSYCNLRLLPHIDDVDKLDARTEDEYEITSLADITKKGLKPIIAGQTSRFNKAKTKKEEELARRKRIAQEQLKTDYERTSKGEKPTE